MDNEQLSLITLKDFKKFIEFRMCSYPFSMPAFQNQIEIDEILNRIAENFGFKNWIEGYHELVK